MKKCPFCKANIEDNARFCLYCMKPLNEKEVVLPRARKSRGWMIAAIVAILLLAAVVVLLILGENIPDDPPISSQQSSFTGTADTQGSSSQPSTTSMPSSTSPATALTTEVTDAMTTTAIMITKRPPANNKNVPIQKPLNTRLTTNKYISIKIIIGQGAQCEKSINERLFTVKENGNKNLFAQSTIL